MLVTLFAELLKEELRGLVLVLGVGGAVVGAVVVPGWVELVIVGTVLVAPCTQKRDVAGSPAK